MPDYGRDISGGTDISPTLQEAEGLTLMQQVCVRRLYTPNQSLLSAPDEQTCDLRQFLSTDSMVMVNGQINTNAMRGIITGALLADARIFSVAVKIEWFPEANYMTVELNGVGAEGPFQLTLGVNRVTVEVLRQ